MRKSISPLLFTLIFLFYYFSANGQTRAVTEYGDTIYIYNNGTWSFEQLDETPELDELAFLTAELKIDTLDSDFSYSPKNKKEVQNTQGQFTIKYNDEQWKRVPPATLNDDAEFAFQSKKSDIWCIVISEETPIEADKLYRIAKKTMGENSGTEPKVIKTELRKVNGTEVIRGVLEASFSGITFIFDSYYFSNELGSVQFTTWTSNKVWERNESHILEMLNGFIVN
jgi:hypothetical protein